MEDKEKPSLEVVVENILKEKAIGPQEEELAGTNLFWEEVGAKCCLHHVQTSKMKGKVPSLDFILD